MKRKGLFTSAKLFTVLTLLCLAVLLGSPATWAAEPVKIGYATSLSGVYTAVGVDMRDGFNLYMDQIGNKAGGRAIKVLVEDIGSNQVSRALDVARKLVERDHINILAGVVGSGSAYALSTFVEKHKLPFVIANAGADDLTQRKNNPFIVRPAFVNSAGSHPLGAPYLSNFTIPRGAFSSSERMTLTNSFPFT